MQIQKIFSNISSKAKVIFDKEKDKITGCYIKFDKGSSIKFQKNIAQEADKFISQTNKQIKDKI